MSCFGIELDMFHKKECAVCCALMHHLLNTPVLYSTSQEILIDLQ